MNLLDICVALIFICCIYTGWKKGLVRMLYSTVGWVLSLLLTMQAHQYVESFLADTGFVYDFIYNFVESGLKLDTMMAEQSLRVQNEFINTLNLPDTIVSGLHAGNNPVLYELFKATNLTEYIYAYLTTLCLNALSLMLTFVIVSAIMQAILKSLNFAARLPVIHSLNRVGGAGAGAIQGLLLVWIAGAFMAIAATFGMMPWFSSMLNSSTLAYQFFSSNIFLNIM